LWHAIAVALGGHIIQNVFQLPQVANLATRFGGVLGAILASVCCVVPLALVMVGISGAWIGRLTALEPYKPYTLGTTAILLGASFWHVYVTPKKACADGTCCARRRKPRRPAFRW